MGGTSVRVTKMNINLHGYRLTIKGFYEDNDDALVTVNNLNRWMIWRSGERQLVDYAGPTQ